MNSLHLSEFRAIANNDLIRDNQQVSFANLEKGTGLCCNVSGEPRTFSQPEKRAAMSFNLRSQFLRLACSQLGRVPIPGDLAGIEAALEEKLLGKDVKVKGGMKPLDKRTIVQVLNLVDGMTKQALPLSAFRALVKASGFGNANSACTGFEEVLFANESRTKLTYGGRDSTRAPMSLKQKASESSLLRKHLLQQACKELDKMPGGEKDVKALLEGKLLGQNAQKSLDVRTIAEVLKDSEIGVKGVEECRFIINTLKNCGLKNELQLDLTLARGLNYYTGAIFEVKALDVQIGSITGGGRYDNLTGIFGMPGLSGVGISFGADRIYDVLNQLDLYPKDSIQGTQVLAINFGEKEAAYALSIINKVRAAGIRAELYPDSAKMKKQMNYANAKQIPFVIFTGESEIAENKLTVKDMNSGEQKTITIDELIAIFK